MTSRRLIELTGTARERGRQHGEELRSEITARVAASLPRVDAALAGPWWQAIQRHDRAELGLVDELSGIAEGSGASLDAVVLLNAFEAFAVADQVELGGCTAIGLPRPAGALIAQNLDGNESLIATYAVHVHRTGPSMLAMVASPGGLGWIGMSSAGVALVNNDLMTPGTRIGLPSQAVRRHALATPTAAAALAAIVATPSGGGRHYMLGDATGAVITVEIAVEADPQSLAHDAPTVHTNHALAPAIATAEDASLLAATYPSTHSRLARARQLLARSTPPDILLSDHDAHPLSVCRHPSPEEPTVTGVSVLFDCATRHATFTFGNPCQATPADTVELDLG